MLRILLLSILLLSSVVRPVAAQTASPTESPTPEPTASVTASPTPTATATTTSTPSPTATTSATSTPTATSTVTPRPTVRATAIVATSPTASPTESPTPVPTTTVEPTFLPIEIGGSGSGGSGSTAAGSSAAATAISMLTHVVVLIIGISMAVAGYVLSGKRIGWIEKYIGKYLNRFRDAEEIVETAPAPVTRASRVGADLVRPMRPRQ